MHYANLQERLRANMIEEDYGQEIDGEPSKCWVWLRRVNRDGYGTINIRLNGKVTCLLAHRVSREVFVGPIPPKHDADHMKGCPRCCIHPLHTSPEPYLQHRAKTAFPKAWPSIYRDLPSGDIAQG